MSYSREDIVNFLSRYVHQVITPSSDIEAFNTIANALHNRGQQSGSNSFSKDVLNRVEAFRVTRSPKKKALILQVRYRKSDNKAKDNKWHNVSWRKSIKKRKRTIKNTEESKESAKLAKLTSALRHHIKYQIRDYRDNYFGHPRCELCDKDNRIELEVDHRPPNTFATIKKDFLKDRGDIKVWWDGQHFRISKQSIIDEWEEYHLRRASLRFLCGDCNRSTKIK